MGLSWHSIAVWQEKDTSKPPIFLRFRSSTTFILSTICIAIFTDIFLYAVIVPVIPFALRIRVGTPEKDVQHQVSILLAVYGAALLGGSPICGFISDRLPNRRLPLLLGLLALMGSTLLLCLGTNMAMMLTGRVLQGLSAAVIWTVGLALLADTVGADSIGQSLGYAGISLASGTLVSPLLGGIVYDKAGYFSVYYMCFGMIILDIFLRFALIEKKVARRWLEQDANVVPGELNAFGEKGHQSASSARPKGSEQAANVKAQADMANVSRVVSRNITMGQSMKMFGSLISSRRLLAALFCTLVGAMLLTAWDAVLPLFVNELFGWHSIGGGLIFLPLIMPTLLAPLIGYWSDKNGPKWPATIGFVFAVPSLVLLRFVNHDGIRQIVLLCALLALIGLADALALTPLQAEIAYLVKQKERSQPGIFGGRGAYATAFGLSNTAFAGGMLVGPLWGGFVKQQAGWGTMGWTIALLSFITAIPAFVFVGGPLFRKDDHDVPAGDEVGSEGREGSVAV